MCYAKDTITAIATPYAQGGIGIIRISGAEAKNIAKKIFKPAKANSNISNLAGYCGLFGHVVYNDKVIDEAILLNFNAPKSYTGEDVVEISVHSGLFILKEVLRAVLNSGARLAQPGEFTKRAFLNQKITLTEAEAVADLISANNEQAHNAALELKQGKLFKFSQTIANELLSVISHVAAFIDYPEEEVADVDLKQLDLQIFNIYSKLCELLKTY
ncbi:MAG: tRNA uridine-5-carboxymethylaminomethyl(34) synthesis GTPase MnmE, partial [Oscillospiraceae bacterium]